MDANWKTRLLLLAGICSLGLAAEAQAQDSITLTNMSYRTGPYAATGTPIMNGQRDYMALLNERDGGINGLHINFNECEFGYNTEKGVECYEKTRGTSLITQPWSTGVTLQVLPRTNVDKIPLLAPGYGFSPMADGKVFAWTFNPPSSYWDGASMILEHVSGGKPESLKGKKIALLYLDSPYGKEPLPVLNAYGEKYDFTILPIPVGGTEMQNQSAQWLQIRRERPDYVLIWGWGAMNGAAIAEALKVKYPMDQFIGIWWSGHDGDLKQFGEQAKGYRSIAWNVAVPEAPLMADMRKYVIDAGKSDVSADDVDGGFYQRGLMISMILAEGVRSAQEHFDTKLINSEQLRYGLENIKMDEARLKELGAEGMIVPFQTTCANHTGHGGAWMLKWDGARFVKESDLLHPDAELITPLETAGAKAYADANAPWIANDACKL